MKRISSQKQFNVRIRVHERDEGRSQLVERLRESRAEILSIGRYGVDVRMTEDLIGRELGMFIEWTNGVPQLVDCRNRSQNRSYPTAYISRKPTFF